MPTGARYPRLPESHGPPHAGGDRRGPRLSRETEAVRRRWVNLIDVLYDRAAELVLVSDHPLDEILDIDGANRDTARTNSRLGLLETRDARV
ncbi:AFG1/ZapE family ATPase [Leucobacter rhizosphaerae]|uniref:AFG1/ZapE family ATPase n=1 Tax=Leucobacter rhizosphaerae TaxID=2932245 RepID=UPI003D2D6E30